MHPCNAPWHKIKAARRVAMADLRDVAGAGAAAEVDLFYISIENLTHFYMFCSMSTHS